MLNIIGILLNLNRTTLTSFDFTKVTLDLYIKKKQFVSV